MKSVQCFKKAAIALLGVFFSLIIAVTLPKTVYAQGMLGDDHITFSSEEGFYVKIANETKSWNGTIEYSMDNIVWEVFNGTKVQAVKNSDDNKYYILFRGIGNSVITGMNRKNKWEVAPDNEGGIYCTGNIMTLLDYNSPSFTKMDAFCFANMFDGCTGLITAPEMPSTDLEGYCYYYMFNNCTNLIEVPILPAITLKKFCYQHMFENCTSLTSVSELPATTLAEYCYSNMFAGCTSLIEAPKLPATTLALYCYNSMFQKCTSLTAGPELPATVLAEGCYDWMFEACTGLIKAPELPATILVKNCYDGMFMGCKKLDTAPDLPATTLADGCYSLMFCGCTNLKLYKEEKSSRTWSIPSNAVSTGENKWNYYMFMDAGGNIDIEPRPGAVYYYEADDTVKTLVSISIKNEPIKKVYTEGENFDPTGMIIEAVYNDESKKDITPSSPGFSFSPSGALTTKDTKITISYTEGSVTKTTTLTIAIEEAPIDAAKLTLDKSGTFAFPGQKEGYTSVEPETVTVTNTGTKASGALTIEISGRNAGSFILSKTSIADIPVGGQDSFTVKPQDNLQAGTYSAVVTVKGEDVASVSFNISFRVRLSNIKLDLCDGTIEGNITSVEIDDNGRLSSLKNPIRDGYVFSGWYTKPDGKGTLVTSDTEIADRMFILREDNTRDYTIYAYWVSESEIIAGGGIRVTGLGDQIYTGGKIEPGIRLYDGTTLLVEGRDYTLSYKNNISAWTEGKGYDSKKQPTITVKGMNNYAQTLAIGFSILPKDLSDDDVTADDISMAAATKEQNINPVVYYQGKALKKNTDYTFTPEKAASGEVEVKITGKGNFTGSRTIKVTFKQDNAKLISKASVTLSKGMKTRTYDPKDPQKPQVAKADGDIVVKSGKNPLQKGTDYDIDYIDNIYPGKATILIIGKGDYAGGIKRVTFTINGAKLAGNLMYKGNLLKSMDYTGEAITFKPSEITLENKGVKITSDDFDISYQNNKKPGTAKIILKGKNLYRGSSITKTFKIDKYTLKNENVTVSENGIFAKGGATLQDIKVTFNDDILIENVDYTVKYSGNKSLTQSAQVTISGKGLFTGKVTKIFKVDKQDLSNLIFSAPTVKVGEDVTKKKFGIIDLDGKALSAGKDFDLKNASYYKDEAMTEALTPEAIKGLGARDVFYVSLKAISGSNYEGTLTGQVKIDQQEIKKAVLKVKSGKSFSYVPGKDLEFDTDSLEITLNGTTLNLDDDFEVIYGTYKKRLIKGSVVFLVRGKGNYCGTKQLKITVSAQNMRSFRK